MSTSRLRRPSTTTEAPPLLSSASRTTRYVAGQKLRGLPVVAFSPVTAFDIDDYERARANAAEAAANATSETMPGLRERKKGWFKASKKNAKNARKKAPPLLYRMDEREIALIGATMRANGFRRTRGANWNVYWASGIALTLSDYQAMGRSQHVNQFPCTQNITRKDWMTRNLIKMQQLHGKRHFDFIPDSFILPAEQAQFREAFRDDGALWIIKPSNASCGRGIFISDDLAEIEEAPLSEEFEGSYIANKYVEQPLLLDGLKFDLRVYVAVTSFDPLRVHVFRDGLARFATEPYSEDRDSLDNPFVHLTNYSINKLNAVGFEEGAAPAAAESPSSSGDFSSGTKRSIRAVFERLVRDGLVETVDELWSKIDDIVIKTVLSIDREVVAATRRGVARAGSCFQMFGFDVLFDEALKPWLIEVNFCPSMNTDAEVDLSIKGRAIANLLTVAGVQPFTHKGLDANKKKRGSGVGGFGKWSSRHTTREDRELAASRVFSLGLDGKFTPEETRVLHAMRAEESRAAGGDWARVFPTASGMHYRTFFDHGDDKRDRLLDMICMNELFRLRADNEGKAAARLEVKARREIKSALAPVVAEAGDDARVGAAARKAAKARVKARRTALEKQGRARGGTREEKGGVLAAAAAAGSASEAVEDDLDAAYDSARARFGFKVHKSEFDTKVSSKV